MPDRQPLAEAALQQGGWHNEYNMLKGNSLLPDTQAGDPEEEFELLDLLGQGAYGSVSKALHKPTGNLYAIKILSATSLSQINSIKKEIQILRLCDNEHIVKYYGSYFKDNNLWIVLEYCHAGSIIDLLNITQKRLSECQIASILESVLKGLVYLHQNKKIHRDIKAANILLNKEGLAKLADFGVSAESMYTNAGHKSQVGSPYWMSPEIMKQSLYTNKTDIWSLGVTAIELAEGVVPNSHLKPLMAMWQLKDKPIQGLKEPSKWSGDFNAFVKDCLNVNPSLRPEAKTLLSHPFVTNHSKGQNLVAEIVQRSLADIEQFRQGQQRYDESEGDLMQLLNRSIPNQARTIVNVTLRSREDKEERLHSSIANDPNGSLMANDPDGSLIVNDPDGSVIVNDPNGSMIVNEHEGSLVQHNESSMLQHQDNQKPTSFLNRYIADMRQNQNQIESQKEHIRRKIQECDEECLKAIEGTFSKFKSKIEMLLSSRDDAGVLDADFVRDELKSKLQAAANVKEFLLAFSHYKDQKEVEGSELAKKKSASTEIAHHSTQTNDPSSGDLAFLRQNQSREVKSQEFAEKEFRTTEKHCFNSKSIISDMENVKYSKELNQNDSRSKLKRFIVTEPYDWGVPQPRPAIMQLEDKAKLKQQFFNDPDVKESILGHIQAVGKTLDFKYDRVAQSTIYHDWAEDSALKHQNSVNLAKATYQTRNYQNGQEYLMPHEEYEEDNQSNVQLINRKVSGKMAKQGQGKKAKVKRQGASAEKLGLRQNGVRQKARPQQK